MAGERPEEQRRKRTDKVFMRIPPGATPEEKRRLIHEFVRRLHAEADKNPEATKSRSPEQD